MTTVVCHLDPDTPLARQIDNLARWQSVGPTVRLLGAAEDAATLAAARARGIEAEVLPGRALCGAGAGAHRVPTLAALLAHAAACDDAAVLVASAAVEPWLARDPAPLLHAVAPALVLLPTQHVAGRSVAGAAAPVLFLADRAAAALAARLDGDAAAAAQPASGAAVAAAGAHALLAARDDAEVLQVPFLRLDAAPLEADARDALQALHDRAAGLAETARSLACSLLAAPAGHATPPPPADAALLALCRSLPGLAGPHEARWLAGALATQHRVRDWAALHAACAALFQRRTTPLGIALRAGLLAAGMAGLDRSAAVTLHDPAVLADDPELAAARGERDAGARALVLADRFGRSLHERRRLHRPLLKALCAAATLLDDTDLLDPLLDALRRVAPRDAAAAA